METMCKNRVAHAHGFRGAIAVETLRERLSEHGTIEDILLWESPNRKKHAFIVFQHEDAARAASGLYHSFQVEHIAKNAAMQAVFLRISPGNNATSAIMKMADNDTGSGSNGHTPENEMGANEWESRPFLWEEGVGPVFDASPSDHTWGQGIPPRPWFEEVLDTTMDEPEEEVLRTQLSQDAEETLQELRMFFRREPIEALRYSCCLIIQANVKGYYDLADKIGQECRL
ncbi:hypothetical protein FRB99_001050, partial [Tulasnella sp. 403]